MCGISAILSTHPERVPTAEILQRMNDVQVHRGPDGEGIELFREGDLAIGLGHRRLSIIDLAGGRQPMSNEDGTVWITYNGEIYNHLALRGELEARGHRYRTRNDSETIVHAYEEWGPDCVERLRGMFAFVIWDARRRQLFAARDRLGIKPFYYCLTPDSLICASEVKAILATGWHAAEINTRAVPEILTFGYLAGEETLYGGIQKLLPGHRMTWKDGVVAIEQYWDVPLPEAGNGSAGEAEFVEQFLSLFRESVRMRLMSDVPLGVFLSGGLDSSAIAATMADQMDEPVKTFSVGFESGYYSEFDFAREVAAKIGADHHEVVLRPDDFFAALPRLIWHEDAPIRNASSLALYQVAELAREYVKVVLTGEGSDELFAGYSRYWASLFNMKWGSRYERLVPRWIRERCIQQTLWRWPLPLSVKRKLSHTFVNHSQRPEEILFDNFHAIFPSRVHQQLFADSMWDRVKNVDPYQDSMRLYGRRSNSHPLEQMLYTDQKTYLVELLKKQDKMSMAASIESRVPFLDHEMVEFATRVPHTLKLHGRDEKYLVKQAMRQLLPESVVSREKMGFPVPIHQWFRQGFDRVVGATLLSDRARQREIFRPSYIEQLLGENARGQRDHTEALWTVLNFELWARIYIDGQPHAAVTEEIMAGQPRTQTTQALTEPLTP